MVMFDDILVHAKSAEEHNQILNKCLARCQEMGLKLNPDKCKLNVDEVKYIGTGGLNDLREDTMITKWEFGKSERTHPPFPT